MSGPDTSWPESDSDSTIGADRARSVHVALLSPVHVAAYRCPPMKFERVSTNGRLSGLARRIPSREARTISIPYTLWYAACGPAGRSPPPRCQHVSGIVFERSSKTDGSFMSFHTPSIPVAMYGPYRPAHHARVSGRVKSGKLDGPAHTLPTKGSPSDASVKCPPSSPARYTASSSRRAGAGSIIHTVRNPIPCRRSFTDAGSG
jgi:hypothetical protein